MTTGLLNTNEAAKLLGLAPQTLAIMRLRGSALPHVKLGRRCLYDPLDIAAFIQTNKRTSTSDKGLPGRSA
jgi:hypothetical protein